MWQFLLAAALAGSMCFATKHFFKLTPQCSEEEQVPRTPSSVDGGPFSGPKKPVMGLRRSRNGVRITKVELRSVAQVRTVQWNGGSRWPLCFKRRRTINNIPGNTSFCSSKASALFDSGVRFGIMCMMAGKVEINELTKTMDKIAKIVEELQSELIIRKSTRPHQVLDYVDNNIGNKCCKTSGNNEIMLKKTKSGLRDTDVKFWSLPVIDNSECESSSPTEDSNPLVLEMDQLEAEFDFELQKLTGHNTIDTNCREKIRPKLEEVKDPNEGYDGTYDLNFKSSQYQGVSPFELNQKLSRLLIEQQENKIVELESKLNFAQSKLQQKEVELQALKNCVTLLTELPIDHETEAHKRFSIWNYTTLESELEKSVGDVKVPIEFDSDVYEHTKYIDKIK